MRTRLHAPDERICPYCLGMNCVYVEDDRVPVIGARLVVCPRRMQHVEVIDIIAGEVVELGPKVTSFAYDAV